MVRGIKPGNLPVPFPPCQLPARIAPRVSLYQGDGLLAGDRAVEEAEHLTVSYGPERIEMTVPDQRCCLLLQSLFHHAFYAPVNDTVQLTSVTCQSCLQNREITFPDGGIQEGGVGPAGALSYLEGTKQPAWIMQVSPGIVFRVNES